MPHPNVAIIQKMWQCFASNDDAGLRELFTPDVRYRMPGHHPIAGTKQGIPELFAFFHELTKSNIKVDVLQIGALGDNMVAEVHHGNGTTKGVTLDVTNCNVYQIENGKIKKVDCYNGNQHAIDNFFNAVYTLRPIPDRLAV